MYWLFSQVPEINTHNHARNHQHGNALHHGILLGVVIMRHASFGRHHARGKTTTASQLQGLPMRIATCKESKSVDNLVGQSTENQSRWGESGRGSGGEGGEEGGGGGREGGGDSTRGEEQLKALLLLLGRTKQCKAVGEQCSERNRKAVCWRERPTRLATSELHIPKPAHPHAPCAASESPNIA